MQHGLKVANMRQSFLQHGRFEPASDLGHQHIFVMAAVEYDHFATRRQFAVNAPQKIMSAFFFCGCGKSLCADAQGADMGEDTANHSVFA